MENIFNKSLEQKKSEKKVNQTEIIKNKAIDFLKHPESVEELIEMPGEHLQAILIYLYNERVKLLKTKDVFKQSAENRFLQHSEVSLKEFISFDNQAIKLLDSDFQTIELSPLAPIGSNSVICSINQKNIVSTSRNTEIVADALPLMAIEYEKIKRKTEKQGKSNNPIHLCTSHRVTRAQSFEKIKGFSSHFRAIFLFSAENFLRKWELIEKYIEKHTDYYLRLIENFSQQSDFTVKDIEVSFSNLKILEKLIEKEGLDRERIRKNTQNPNFDIFTESDINLPSKIGLKDLDERVLEKIEGYELTKQFQYLYRNLAPLIEKMKKKYPLVKFNFDLSRVAGVNYYNNISFKISATNQNRERYPLVDGGFVDWADKLAHSKGSIALSSGFGTELFIDKFKTKK